MVKRMTPSWRTVEPPPEGIILTGSKGRLRPPSQLARLVTELPLDAVGGVGIGSVFAEARFYSITPKGM